MDRIRMGRSFSVLHRKSQLVLVAACERLQLTYSEYMMLIRLYDEDGLSQEQLSAVLYLDKAVITRTVTLLEKKGFVHRVQDTVDRRVKHVYLTEKGQSEREFIRGTLISWADYLTAGLSKEELTILTGSLQKMLERINEASIYEMARNMEEKLLRKNG